MTGTVNVFLDETEINESNLHN